MGKCSFCKETYACATHIYGVAKEIDGITLIFRVNLGM